MNYWGGLKLVLRAQPHPPLLMWYKHLVGWSVRMTILYLFYIYIPIYSTCIYYQIYPTVLEIFLEDFFFSENLAALPIKTNDHFLTSPLNKLYKTKLTRNDPRKEFRRTLFSYIAVVQATHRFLVSGCSSSWSVHTCYF